MVPRRDECPVTGIASKANFVTANAVDTILAVPRRVDLEPVNYLEKEDYGKVPKYLQQVLYVVIHVCRMIQGCTRSAGWISTLLLGCHYTHSICNTMVLQEAFHGGGTPHLLRKALLRSLITGAGT